MHRLKKQGFLLAWNPFVVWKMDKVVTSEGQYFEYNIIYRKLNINKSKILLPVYSRKLLVSADFKTLICFNYLASSRRCVSW